MTMEQITIDRTWLGSACPTAALGRRIGTSVRQPRSSLADIEASIPIDHFRYATGRATFCANSPRDGNRADVRLRQIDV